MCLKVEKKKLEIFQVKIVTDHFFVHFDIAERDTIMMSETPPNANVETTHEDLMEEDNEEHEVDMGILDVCTSKAIVVEHPSSPVKLIQSQSNAVPSRSPSPPQVLKIVDFENIIESESEVEKVNDEDEEELRMFLEGEGDDDDCMVIPPPEITMEDYSNPTSSYSHLHPALLQEHAVPRRRPVFNRKTAMAAIMEARLSSMAEASPSGSRIPNILKKKRSSTACLGGPPVLEREEPIPTFVILQEPEPAEMSSSLTTKCLQPPIRRGPDDFACPYCERTYKLKPSCESHIKIHEGNENNCHICGQVLSRQRDLKRHIRKMHNGGVNVVSLID